MAMLPDPGWISSLPHCLSCGYALAGIAPPGPCPECAAPFGERYLVVHGVPKATAVNPNRRIEIIFAVVVLLVVSQVWMYAMFRFGFILTAAGAAGAIAVAWFVVQRGNRSEGGKCRFIFSPAGVANQSMQQNQLEGYAFVRWNGNEHVTITRVSSVWQTLRIGIEGATPTFVAGIRCKEHDVPSLRAHLEAIIRPAQAPDAGSISSEGTADVPTV